MPQQLYRIGKIQKVDQSHIAFHHHCFKWHDHQMLNRDQAKIGKKNKPKPMQEYFEKYWFMGVFVSLVMSKNYIKRRKTYITLPANLRLVIIGNSDTLITVSQGCSA
jgi:hypothetical protein